MSALIPPNEQARLEALRSYGILDTEGEEECDAITRLAAYLCGTPIALISLVDATRQWFKSKVGLDVDETTRDVSFCAHTILQSEPLVVPDAQKDPRFSQNPLVTSNTNIRFYAGMPLRSEKGLGLGSLCVIDKTPRQLAPEQIEGLEVLGRAVVTHLQLRRALQLLDDYRLHTNRLTAEGSLSNVR
jgi:GAF domain-containing protein